MVDKLTVAEEREPVGRNLLRFHGAKLEGGMTILTEFMPTSLREDQVLPQQRYDFTLAQWREEAGPQCVCGP